MAGREGANTMANLIAENGSAQLVAVRFSFSRWDKVLDFLPKEHGRIDQIDEVRKSLTHGKERTILEGVENTDASSLGNMLKEAGYQLVNAFYEVREDKKPAGTCPHGTFYSAEFIFAPSKAVTFKGPSSVKKLDQWLDVLNSLAGRNFWRVRAYEDPLASFGLLTVDGLSGVSFFFEARRPRFNRRGDTMVEWQKDDSGNRVGDAPIPIRASGDFAIVNGEPTVIVK